VLAVITRSIVLLWFVGVSALGYAAETGAPTGAKSKALPGVSAQAVRAGIEATDAIFARGAVPAADGGGGYYMDRIEESLSILPDVTLIRVRDDILIARIYPSQLFDRNHVFMHTAGKTLLVNMSERLRFFPKAAIVAQVHTDPGGNEQRNLRLSERRANSIMSQLEGIGVDKKRMAAFGYGDRYPLPPGQLSSARVDILLRTR
jgi:outer membrane protein OmpA-like peptidoglycan-associated protein